MKKVVAFGEIMMRLNPRGHLRLEQATEMDVSYGGSEANVVSSLAQWGYHTKFVSRVPANQTGNAAIRALNKYGVNCDHVLRSGDRLGLYFLENGSSVRGSKVVYDRENSGMATLQPGMIDWDKVFDGADWFHWSGITPAISSSAAEVTREAVIAAAEKEVKISTDLNYRSTLWKYGTPPDKTMGPLVEHTNVLFANLDAARVFFNTTSTDNHALCMELAARYGKVEKVVVTNRGQVNASQNLWSGLLYDKNDFFESRTYDITHIVDRVGAGDAFMAGLIHGMISFGDDHQKTVDFATAASAYKHTISGDVNQASTEEVMDLVYGEQFGKVKR